MGIIIPVSQDWKDWKGEFNESLHVKSPEQCLAKSKLSIQEAILSGSRKRAQFLWESPASTGSLDGSICTSDGCFQTQVFIRITQGTLKNSSHRSVYYFIHGHDV